MLLEILHLYPIMLLNLAAALANIDPALEEAAANLGANRWRRFQTVTFPLLRPPGYFAGAVIVFIWVFTDLGMPLMFDFRRVVPVQILDRVKDIHSNPIGYALVAVVIALTAGLFALSRRLAGAADQGMMARRHTGGAERPAAVWETLVVWAGGGLLVTCALLPHLGVLLTSLATPGKWFMTVLPTESTLEHYGAVYSSPDTLGSIRNSLFYASLSTLLDIVLPVAIAWLIVRRHAPTGAFLDTLAMMPLALPGVVLAFAFAMLELSDSLILAMHERFFPIARAGAGQAQLSGLFSFRGDHLIVDIES